MESANTTKSSSGNPRKIQHQDPPMCPGTIITTTEAALEAISNLEVSEQSYDLAWQLLDRRYNSKRRLLESKMRFLSDSKFRTQKNDSLSTFVKQNVLANIKELQVSTDAMYQDVVMELVLPRLYSDCRARFRDREERMLHLQKDRSVQDCDEFLSRYDREKLLR